jgi:hypothetical protein
MHLKNLLIHYPQLPRMPFEGADAICLRTCNPGFKLNWETLYAAPDLESLACFFVT